MRNPDAARAWAPSSPDFLVLPLDVTEQASIDAALAKVTEQLGALGALVNNAGYGMLGAFEASTAEQVERQFRTNVFGLMNVTRSVLPGMRERRDGAIVNISSVGGQVTFPFYSCYHSTKWAVEGFSESLQFELKSFNVRVKLVEPGPIKTDFYDRSQDLVKKEGLSAYDRLLQKALPRMQTAGQRAPGPEVVAEAIYAAVTDGTWKLRYPVNSAPVLWLRKLTPEGLFRKLISGYLMR